MSFTIQHFLAFANEAEPIEFSPKYEDIGPQIFKLFGNIKRKSEKRESLKSQGPVRKFCKILKNKIKNISIPFIISRDKLQVQNVQHVQFALRIRVKFVEKSMDIILTKSIQIVQNTDGILVAFTLILVLKTTKLRMRKNLINEKVLKKMKNSTKVVLILIVD